MIVRRAFRAACLLAVLSAASARRSSAVRPAAAIRPASASAAEGSGSPIVGAAAKALGGIDRLAALDAWLVEGRGRENLSAELQGIAPNGPTWRRHEEAVAVVRSQGDVSWQRRTGRNDRSLRWRRFIYKADGFGVVDWTAGFAAMRPAGRPAPEREALMRRIPHLLILEAATKAAAIRTLETRRVSGEPFDAVEAELSGGERLTLMFSRGPVLLRRLEYAAELPGFGPVVVGWAWSGWLRDAALGWIPSGHAVDVAGTPFQEVLYSRYEASTPEAAAMMELPRDLRRAEGTEAPPAPGGPAAGEVAPGVHVAEVRGFTVAFVELTDSVVLFEAPAAAIGLESIPASGQSSVGAVTRDAVALVEKTCPGKPVKTVVVSHHHGDHLGGVAGVAAAGSTVLVAPGNAAAARRALGDQSPGVRVEIVADRRLIQDGARRVEVLRVRENPHTAENLFLWLPEERILFQGDLFYFEEGAPFPPPGRAIMNRFFADWLAARGIAPKAIYGVHNRGAAGPEALARSRSPEPPAPDPLGLYLRSIELLNSHDAEGKLASYAPGAILVGTDGSRAPIDLARQRGYRKFEAATNARFDYTVVSVTGDAVESFQTEASDFIRALGLPEIESHWRERYCGRLTCELAHLGRDEEYLRRCRLFREWLAAALPASDPRGLLREGEVVFDGRTAAPLVELAKKWRTARKPSP